MPGRLEPGHEEGAVQRHRARREPDRVIKEAGARRVDLEWSDTPSLGTEGWGVRPLQVDAACSSFFDDPVRFPPGSVALDSAFLMAGLETTWHPQPRLLADAPAGGLRASR